jgi:DNA-binding NarL/FixJ family response regulator
METTDTIKILLADDHKILCEGLRSLIKQERPKWEVLGEATDGASAVQLASELSPDIIIMDISMSGLNGIEATRRITSSQPSIKVLSLSMHWDRRYIVDMFKAGARGYLLKDSAIDELIFAIEAVVANRIYLSPQLADATITDGVRLFPGIN